MSTLLLLLLFHLIIKIQSSSGATDQVQTCSYTSCGDGIEIKFPFGLKGTNQSNRCSYPDFSVWCNNQSQTIYTLPGSSGGDLVIKSIDYSSQTITVNDPGQCLPKRFLQARFNLSSSPFKFDPMLYNLVNLTFLLCPSNLTQNPLPTVHCLKDLVNSSFYYTYFWTRSLPSFLNESCEVVNSSVPYPISSIDPWPFWVDLGEDLQLTWDRPRCGRCEYRGQDCGFADDISLTTACFSRPHESSGIVSLLN